jgi:hypothetical protein
MVHLRDPIRELDNVKAGTRLPYPDPNVRLYTWTRGNETILTAWTVEGTANLKLNLGQSSVTDAFGSTRQMNVAGDLALSDFPLYIKGIGNMAPVNALITQARSEEAARRQELARLAKARTYLFDFGSTDKVGTMEVGTTRNFTPVLAKDVYDEAKGYGFSPGAAMSDNSRGWVSDPLETDAVRVGKGHGFRIRVAPGRYKLQVSAVTVGGPSQVVLKGATGGDKILSISRDEKVVEADVRVEGDSLVLEFQDYGDFRWLALVEQQ